jgi:hypothetical protein
MVSPAGSVYGINSFRVIDINRKLLQLGRGIVRKAWKRSSSPEGRIQLGITDRFAVVMDSISISSHDIGSDDGALNMCDSSDRLSSTGRW